MTIQYSDDSLIICKAWVTGARALKEDLDRFSAATGLSINFSKSTMITINSSSDIELQINEILNCKKESFPLLYLGLPLSPHKMQAQDLNPTIAKVDKYLARWEACLLSYAERIVLINSVLNTILIYAMYAFKLPPGIIDTIDKRRRVFLWT